MTNRNWRQCCVTSVVNGARTPKSMNPVCVLLRRAYILDHYASRFGRNPLGTLCEVALLADWSPSYPHKNHLHTSSFPLCHCTCFPRQAVHLTSAHMAPIVCAKQRFARL